MIKKFTIYGERCSGTNYLETIIKMNFDVDITWEYGWKHFFGIYDDLIKDSDDTLFICIVRNLPDWINSFYRSPYHLPKNLKNNVKNFLNNEFYSLPYTWDSKKRYGEPICKILGEDRNMFTGKRYKNIFELRHVKIKWMLENLPNIVKNYLFIRYEDLIDDFKKTLFTIKNKGLKVKKNINFPLNTNMYYGGGSKGVVEFKKNINTISNKLIFSNSNLIKFYEKELYNI